MGTTSSSSSHLNSHGGGPASSSSSSDHPNMVNASGGGVSTNGHRSSATSPPPSTSRGRTFSGSSGLPLLSLSSSHNPLSSSRRRSSSRGGSEFGGTGTNNSHGNTNANATTSNAMGHLRPYPLIQRTETEGTATLPLPRAYHLDREMSSSSLGAGSVGGLPTGGPVLRRVDSIGKLPPVNVNINSSNHNEQRQPTPPGSGCRNPPSEINARLDTQVEVKVYPCNNNNSSSANNNSNNGKKKFTQFTVKPEGVIIQGTNRRSDYDLGSEYARHIGRKLQRYELADTRACQLLVTSHAKSFWVVPAPEAFSRHSGTCRLLGDRKHGPTPHVLQVGDFLRVGSVGVVVIETHDGVEQKSLSEDRIQKIMRDTASGNFVDAGETDGENSDVSRDEFSRGDTVNTSDVPVCYMCFDESDEDDNPLITPCKCIGDTRYVHVDCLRKWHTAEADNQICFLSSVDATCSVCKSTFKSDFKLRNGKLVKLFKSSLEPPYISLLIATKHEMAQRLFNTRFQLSFHTILKADRKNSTRPLLLGRSSGSDMVLDYRTVSARHASIRFKNGEFVFSDAQSSNGSYLYLRRPVELGAASGNQSVQFRLGRSMISMKVVNKWNRRLLRAVRRSHSSNSAHTAATDVRDVDDDSANGGGDHPSGKPDGDADFDDGSEDEEVNVTNELTGKTFRSTRRTRESILRGLPAYGTLLQSSPQHLELLHALAYPKKHTPAHSGASGTSHRPRLTGAGGVGVSVGVRGAGMGVGVGVGETTTLTVASASALGGLRTAMATRTSVVVAEGEDESESLLLTDPVAMSALRLGGGGAAEGVTVDNTHAHASMQHTSSACSPKMASSSP